MHLTAKTHSLNSTLISNSKGSALSEKPFNGVKLDGEPNAFAEISVSQASQGLLDLLSSSAKEVNSLPSLQEVKSQSLHNLGTQTGFEISGNGWAGQSVSPARCLARG